VLWLHFFGFDGFGAASIVASRRQAEHGCPSTARAMVTPCAGPLHPQRPLAPPATTGHTAPTLPRGSYKTSYTVEATVACLDGLVLTPIGGRGRGPPRHGAHTEVVATAGKSLVQRWSPPLVKRWSPLLASRSELAFNATLLVQSIP
jgi:hypothetical protein